MSLSKIISSSNSNSNLGSLDHFFEDDVLNINNYKIIKEIGRGTYGKVYLSEFNLNQRQYAMKVFSNGPQFTQSYMVESKMLQQVQDIPHCQKIVFSTDNFNFKGIKVIVSEFYSNGTLLDYVNNNYPLPQDFIRKIFKQLILALDQLHQMNIAHMDIKPENIFLDKDLNIVIGDFGMCIQYGNENSEVKFTKVGTPGYQLPEIAQKKAFKPVHFDIFAAGVTLFAICTRSLPFSFDFQKYKQFVTQNQMYWKNAQKSFSEIQNEFLTDDFIDLFTKMVNLDPNRRISIDQIFKHQWMQI